MAFTFRDLKQAKQNIMDGCGLSSSDAVRVVGYYNGGGPALRPDIVTAMISGDLSGVAPALVALGITNNTDTTSAAKPAAGDLQKGSAAMEPAHDLLEGVHTSGNASAGSVVTDEDCITAGPDGVGDDLHADGFQNAPQRKESKQAAKRPTKQKKSNTSPQAVKDPHVVHGVHGGLYNGDVVGGDDIEIAGDSGELPPGLHDDVCAIIDGFADSHGIQDKQKIHPLQFGAACTLVGVSIKKRGILLDVERNRREGGVKYDPHKVLALLYLYEYICSSYKQVPFSHNFPKFAGVSREYFNDYAKQGLTSSHLAIAQKAHEIQRAGLVDAVNGGGSATVGNIFLSKALAGLQETVTIQHVSAASTPAAAALPVFDGSGGILPDKTAGE